MKGYLVLLLNVIFVASSQFNIQNTNGPFWITKYSQKFINYQTAEFPEGSFLLKILYGHIDVPFTLRDLYNNYGANASIMYPGYIIIGNDFQNGGIVLDNLNIILPVPEQNISIIHSTYDLPSYFPNGFIIKQSFDDPKLYPVDLTQVLLNNSAFCSGCNSYFINIKNLPIFDLNEFWTFNIQSRDSQINIILMGYIDFIDGPLKSARLKFIYSSLKLGGKFQDLRLIEDDISFVKFDDQLSIKNFTLTASLNAYNTKSALYIQGKMRLSSQKEI